jgi:hypothetical protein
MGVASFIFAGLEAPPKNRADADGVEIVRRDDAARRDLGAVTDT